MTRVVLARSISISLCAVAMAAVSTVHAQTVGLEMVKSANQRIVNVYTDELERLIKTDPSLVLVDVRSEQEITARGGMIDGSREIIMPRGWLEFRAANDVPSKDTPIVVYCGINQRSPLAADQLQRMGYTNVKNYADGFLVWRDRGLPVKRIDQAPNSMLYRKAEKVIDGVWSAIGATSPATYSNSGHNNNLSFIVGDEAVLVFNAGDNYLLAKALHEEIKAVTAKPVKYVVLENGQGHAMLGSSYWQEQGVPVIAHADTVHEIEEHGADILDRMLTRNGPKGAHTRLTTPDKIFTDELIVDLGSLRVELRNLGPAHSPGDIVAWLPDKRLVITGDVAFHQRLLPVFEHTDTAAWIETWPALEALNPVHVVPGHGDPTNISEVTQYTRDYLMHLRGKIEEVLDDGGDLQQAYGVDQSPYAHLDTYYELARTNAGRVFRAMEFE